MDPSDHDHHHHHSKSKDENTSRKSKEIILGPRPPPLKLRKDSHKIKKPPLPPREPVIIYTDSPTVIHTHPNDFMTLVQSLTGQTQTQTQTTSSSSLSSLPSSSSSMNTQQRDKEVCTTTREMIHHHHHHHHHNHNHDDDNDDNHHENCVIEEARLSEENMSANLFNPAMGEFLADDSINYSMTTSPSSLDLFNNYFDS